MKRFHVHVRVDDLAKSIDFYSKLMLRSDNQCEARQCAGDGGFDMLLIPSSAHADRNRDR